MSKSEWEAIDVKNEELRLREARIANRERELSERFHQLRKDQVAWGKKLSELVTIENIFKKVGLDGRSPFDPVCLQTKFDFTPVIHAEVANVNLRMVDLYREILKNAVAVVHEGLIEACDRAEYITDHRLTVLKKTGKFAVHGLVNDLDLGPRFEPKHLDLGG